MELPRNQAETGGWILSVFFRALVVVLLACLLLVGLAKLAGKLVPPGELMPVSIARDPTSAGIRSIAHPNIVMVDLSRNLDYWLTWGDTLAVNPERSPDGTRVAYSSYGHSQLFIADLRTGQQVQITNQPALYSVPTWSPDGTQLAFSATSAGATEIYVMNLNDGSLRQLTTGFGPDTHPAWSPDGRWLAYISGDGFDPADLYVMPLDCPEANGVCSTVARQMTDQPGFDWSPVWSPDGRQIVFASDRGGKGDIYVMDTDCLNADPNTPCFPNVRPMTQQHFSSSIIQINWAQDGKQIRFVVQHGTDATIYALDAGCDVSPDGCTLRQLAVVP